MKAREIMKRILNIALIIAMLVGATGITPVAALETDVCYMTNFSDNPRIGMNAALSNYVSLHNLEDGVYNDVLRVRSIDESEFPNRNTTVGYVPADDVIVDGEALISFDIKPNQATQTVKVIINEQSWLDGNSNNEYWGEQEAMVFSVNIADGATTGSIYNYPNGGSGVAAVVDSGYVANQWHHVDMLVNLDTDKIQFWVDGTPGKYVLDMTKFNGISGVAGVRFDLLGESPHSMADGTATVDVDNVSITKMNSDGFRAKVVNSGEDFLELMFSERVLNPDSISAEVERVTDGDSIQIAGCEVLTNSLIRINLDENLSKGTEYRIKLQCDDIKSFLINKYTGNSVYYYKDFEEGGTELYSVEDGYPNPVVKENRTNAVSDISDYYEIVDIGGEHGKVMQLSSSTDMSIKEVTFGFDLPERTTASKVRYSFDVMGLQESQSMAAMINTPVVSEVTSNESGAQAYAVVLNNTTFTMGNNGLSAWNGGYVSGMPYSANVWTTIVFEYDFVARTFKGYYNGVLKSSGTLHIRALDSNSIKNVAFEIRDNAVDAAQNADVSNYDRSTAPAKIYIDNVKVEDITPKYAVKSVRFSDWHNNILMPEDKISTLTNKIKVSFNETSIADVSAELTENGVDVGFIGEVNDGIYEMTLNDQILNPNSSYILNITSITDTSGSVIPINYEYIFETAIGVFEVAEFKILKNGDVCRISDLHAGDVVEVRATLVNTTEKEQPAVLSYGVFDGNKMYVYDYFDMGMSETTKINTKTLSYTVTSEDIENDFGMTAFLWRDFKGNRPIYPNVNIAD